MGGAHRDTGRGRLRSIGNGVVLVAMLAGCGSHDDSARSVSTTDGGVAESGGASQGGASGAVSVVGAAGAIDTDAGCQRDVTAAAIALEGAQPFDLVIVADNSDSLSFSRDDLSTGAGVTDFAQTLVQTKFPLSLKKDEHLTSVHVIGQNAADRTLPPTDYSYDPLTDTVTVDAAALRTTDVSLRFEITSDCRPIVR